MCLQPILDLNREIFEKSHVLIVEDSPINRAITANFLHKLGCQVSFAENGQEAVEKLQKADFHLVLMDIEMPVMDGYTATRLIRQQEFGQDTHTKIIAVTTRTAEDERARCFSVGMDDFMAKPLTEQGLTNMLMRWLCANAGSVK